MRFLLLLLTAAMASSVGAWDYEGHRLINQLALTTLPTNFPGFVKTPQAVERIGFLAGEPDRWRNTPDLSLKHANGPDHYIDLEELNDYGLRLEDLPVFRYDFTSRLAVTRKANPEKFHTAAGKNEDHTLELLGLLPWAMTESYGKLKSGFSYLKAYEEQGGTRDEIENARQNIIYVMGVMGHWAGDSTQPLHTTVHHHGWVGPNPNSYSTNRSIHSWVDGGFFAKAGGVSVESLRGRLRPAQLVRLNGRPAAPEELFQATIRFIEEQHTLVEKVYQLDKAGLLNGRAAEGREFMEGQLTKAAQFLGDVWFSAWQHAPPDTFLVRQLGNRLTPGTQTP